MVKAQLVVTDANILINLIHIGRQAAQLMRERKSLLTSPDWKTMYEAQERDMEALRKRVGELGRKRNAKPIPTRCAPWARTSATSSSADPARPSTFSSNWRRLVARRRRGSLRD